MLQPRREVIQSSFGLLAGSGQSRRLRTPDSAIAHLHCTCPGSRLRWRERHADCARGRGAQTRTAGRRRNAIVSRRRNADPGERYALQVMQREQLRRTCRPNRLLRIRCADRSQSGLDASCSRQGHCLRTGGCVVGQSQGSSTRSKSGRRKGDFDDAVLSCSERASAGLRAGGLSEIAAGGNAADVQRRSSGVG